MSAKHAQTAEVRIYNTLFAKPDPAGGENFAADLNPMSLEVFGSGKIEPALGEAQLGKPVQFERLGYLHAGP